MKKVETHLLKSLDWVSVGIYILLVTLGCFNIYSATYDPSNTSWFDASQFVGKQLIWVGFSSLLIIFTLLIDAGIYKDIAYPAYLIMLFLLIATIFLSPDIKGSHSWLTFGSVSIQPAEFSKFTTTIALARFLSSIKESFTENSSLFLTALGIVFLPMGIIVLQSETGSALIYFSFFLLFYREGMSGAILLFALSAVVLFLLNIRYGSEVIFAGKENAGVFFTEAFICLILIFVFTIGLEDERAGKWIFLSIIGLLLLRYIANRFYYIPVVYLLTLPIVGSCVYAFYIWGWKSTKRFGRRHISIILIVLFSVFCSWTSQYFFHHVLKDYQRARIEVTLGVRDDPKGMGYNINQSKIAIGSGRLLGKGFCRGTQTKLKYVPEQHTDFIFCTVGEEWGFLGSSMVLLLYSFLILRLLYLAERQTDKFAMIYGYCLVGIFISHLIVNIGMVVGITPVIGIPLPFFSYGGSSLWGFTLLLFGFLRLDIARKGETEEATSY